MKEGVFLSHSLWMSEACEQISSRLDVKYISNDCIWEQIRVSSNALSYRAEIKFYRPEFNNLRNSSFAIRCCFCPIQQQTARNRKGSNAFSIALPRNDISTCDVWTFKQVSWTRASVRIAFCKVFAIGLFMTQWTNYDNSYHCSIYLLLYCTVSPWFHSSYHEMLCKLLQLSVAPSTMTVHPASTKCSLSDRQNFLSVKHLRPVSQVSLWIAAKNERMQSSIKLSLQRWIPKIKFSFNQLCKSKIWQGSDLRFKPQIRAVWILLA